MQQSVGVVDFPLWAPSFFSRCSVLSCSVVILWCLLWKDLWWKGEIILKFVAKFYVQLIVEQTPSETVWNQKKWSCSTSRWGSMWMKKTSSCGCTSFCVGAEEMLVCPSPQKVSWDDSVIMDSAENRPHCSIHCQPKHWYQEVIQHLLIPRLQNY